MAFGQYKITEQFEKDICEYTGAPYCVAVDSCSNALFLSLTYAKQAQPDVTHVTIPKRTFPSVACEIIHVGLRPRFSGEGFNGLYMLSPFKIYDSALRFTTDMYRKGSFMCISFTGPRKRLKLSKGGAILTDDAEAVAWLRSARMSGRHEMPFMEDNIAFAGWNFYMLPEIAARGIALLREFYSEDGKPLPQEDVKLDYPDLSKMDAFRQYTV